MEQKTLQCTHCREMNYPMVEFCRYCGESLHSRPAAVKSGLMVKWIHHGIDAMFWMVDETVRWWEIGKLSIMLKTLRRQRANLLNRLEDENPGSQTSVEEQHALVGITEELARLSNREEFLRSKCWAMTPDLLFIGIFLVFAYGLFAMNPTRSLLPRRNVEAGIFRGQVSRVRDLPFNAHSVISVAEWFENKLYVGGDGGLSVIDPVSGVATQVVELPADFFVRDLAIDGDRLFIAGFPGIYILENTVIKSFYHEKQLPVKLVNSLAVSGPGNLLIGTVGQGMLRGGDDSAVFVLGTQNRTIRDFGRLGSEMWIMHEDGILTGRTDNFESLNLQVLAGRHLRSMITTERNVFIGTDQGVVAGYRNARSWVWTLLSAGKPGYVNDLIVSGDILFIGSDEGVYRFNKGRMDRLSSVPCQALAIGSSFLAAVNPDSIMLFYFSGGTGDSGSSMYSSLPEIGTFTPSFPVVSMVPLPKLQYGRLPDFGRLDQENNRKALTISPVASESFAVVDRPHVPLPAELQKPVFSDIEKLGSNFILATQNRGVWIFDGTNWSLQEGIPQIGVSSLVCNSTACFAYGPTAGIFQVGIEQALQIVSAEHTPGLLHVFAEADNTLLMLFKDGSIKSWTNGQLHELIGIPGEFRGDFHSLWKFKDRFLVVVDKGVMVHESDRQWNLIFFKGRIDNTRIAAVERGPDENLFIALEDGRIFEFKADKLEFVGVISDQPVALNYDGCLWVAGKESLFFLENKNFVSAPFHTTDKILGAFPSLDKDSVMVFTDFGVNVIAGR